MHMNSGISLRALPVAARTASLCALLLSLASCSDTGRQDLPGLRPAAANTSEQAVLQTDLVATETVNGSTHSYVATLPPAAVVGTISQTMEANWNASLHGISEPPIYPQGWSLDYYAGSTKLPSEPATASEWAQVSRVVASGATQVEALDGERQALISTVSAPVTVVASSFAGGSAGDGWNVFFDAGYTRVFNIHHHDSPATVMCRNISDATPCPGFPIDLTQTSFRSTGRIDELSNKLWQPTVTNAPKLGWDCVDLTTAARCAKPLVLSQYAALANDYNDHVDPVVIGRKMYALGYISGGVTRITCLNMATGTECPGLALPQNGNFAQAGLAAVGTRLYVLPGQNLNLDCYETTTWKRCAGSWPQAVSGGPVWAVHSADGVIRNVCTGSQCFALDGTAHTLSPNFGAYLASQPVQTVLGSASSVGTKAAWSIGGRTTCWDMATDDKCSAAFPITVGDLYATVLDPLDPDCLWTNGDDGIIRNWKISTGAQGCSPGTPHIYFRAAASIPRLSCDPDSRVYQYKSFRLISPDPSKYASAKLSVRDSNGVPILGWTDVAIPANSTLDLTSLSPTVTGSTPLFDITTFGLIDTSVVPSGEFRVTTGAPPQLCWDLAGPTPVCPAGPGLAGNGSAPQQTTVTAKGSYTSGSGTTSFTDQVLSTTIDNSPNFNNCGGTRLRATVVSQSDGQPVAGAAVFLLDSAGTSILNASGLPATAVTAADGTVEFPVWAAGYMLKLSSNGSFTPVSATVDVGGSGTTQAASGTVVSNTVTTTVDKPSHVTFSVNTAQGGDHEPPCAPVVTSPPGGTVVYTSQTPLTGTSVAGSTVTVRANGQIVCTVVANSQGEWSCTAELPVGTSTVNATAVDAAGNVSGVSSGVLITRRDSIDPPVIAGPGASVHGPGVTVTGTGKPGADITVTDEQGQSVCTAKVDDAGAWQCDGTLTAGQHQLTATADWQGLQGISGPHDTTVLDEAWFQGSGCASTGGAPPALMMLLALGGLAVMRRRRA